MTHEGRIDHVKDGIYTAGRRAACTCGWTAPTVRDTHAAALRDQFTHVTDLQETPVPAPAGHHTLTATDDTGEEVDW